MFIVVSVNCLEHSLAIAYMSFQTCSANYIFGWHSYVYHGSSLCCFSSKSTFVNSCEHWPIITVMLLPEKLLCSEGRRYSQAPDGWYWTSFRCPLDNWGRSEYSASSLSLVNTFYIYSSILTFCVSRFFIFIYLIPYLNLFWGDNIKLVSVAF